MRASTIVCCLALALLPLGGCGESSPRSGQAGGSGYGPLFTRVTQDVSNATAVLRGVHKPGDVAGAKQTLDAIAARIEASNDALNAATRPDQAGYDQLRPAAESL